MNKHKFNIFPEAEAQDYARLLDDIRSNGFDKTMPITLYEGAILDGWNRWRACQQLGIDPTSKEFEGTDDDAMQFAMRSNKRRNLTSSQWAAIAVEAEEILEAIAKEAEGLANKKRSQATKAQRAGQDNLLSAPANEHATKTAHKAAELFNTNRTYINDAKKLRAASPERFEKIKSGGSTLTQAKREMKEEARESRREENRAKVAEAATPDQIAQSGARFSTIVIDPPWDWGDEGDQDQLGRARPDYATMSKAQLLELPLPNLSDEDCHIYLWITNRSLPKGFELLDRWGFRYVTAITWAKPHFGMGNYFRGQTEHVLFGVKGSQPLKRKDVGTLFTAARGKGGHSSKPPEFYDLVESCSPGPYLEMFSRSDRDGWKTWGENT